MFERRNLKKEKQERNRSYARSFKPAQVAQRRSAVKALGNASTGTGQINGGAAD